MRSDNKRIVFNSIVLYIKLILSTLIGLYASRVVLNALGASDYGLYNVVGGIVSMMNFLGITMISVTNRFIIVEMGKGEQGNCRKVFNTSLVIHIFLALLLVILGETVGVYYIENVANFAPGKTSDALFVLHMSMLACVFNILYIPYNGLILAREKFVFTSVVEIGRTLLKLTLVIWLATYLGNRLRAYSVIMCIYSVMLPICLFAYCRINDRDIVKWMFNKDKRDYIAILRFAFWIMIGAIASICQIQGSNMIINLFFGTVVNAAFGIATQVNNYVSMFISSFNQAANPQIMKTQGSNKERSSTLVYATTKFSFLILLIPSFALILNIEYVLKLWLVNVPPFTSVFITLMLITGLINSLGSGFDASIQASGRIRLYQIVYSGVYIIILPIVYFLFQVGMPVITINLLIMAGAVILLVFRIYYLSSLKVITGIDYFHHTFKPCMMVVLTLLPMVILNRFIPYGMEGFTLSLSTSLLWNILSVYVIGFNKDEKKAIKRLAGKVVRRTNA